MIYESLLLMDRLILKYRPKQPKAVKEKIL